MHRAVEHNRIAREIHDSVGHALSLVTVQAAAARKVISRDPDFATQVLDAIEQASRSATADLDHALGLLRDDHEPAARRHRQDLTAVDSLVADELYLSLETVKTHVRNVLAKLGARNRVHAVITAYETGLVPL